MMAFLLFRAAPSGEHYDRYSSPRVATEMRKVLLKSIHRDLK